MENKCQFLITAVKDLPATKMLAKKFRPQVCGEPAAVYDVTGGVAKVRLPLCDQHRNFVILDYGWKMELVR